MQFSRLKPNETNVVGAAQSRWREPKEIIIKNRESFSISPFYLSTMTTNFSRAKSFPGALPAVYLSAGKQSAVIPLESAFRVS